MESKAKKFLAKTNRGAVAGMTNFCGQFIMQKMVDDICLWLHSKENKDLLEKALSNNKSLQSKIEGWREGKLESLKNLETIIQVLETMKVKEAD
jgi:hypothetical protein